MNEKQLIQRVRKEYEKIERVWRELHWYMMIAVSAAITLVEFVMFFTLLHQGSLFVSPVAYLLLYVLLPTLCNALLLYGSYWCMTKVQLKHDLLNYLLSIVFVIICFILGLFQGTFSAVSGIFVLPIIMTVTYGDKALTTVTAFLCIIGNIFTSLVFHIKPNGVRTDPINVLISTVIFLSVYLASMVIMLFQKRKQIAAMKNDLERHRLRMAVLTDDLTGVLNKQALREYFDRMMNDDTGACYYLAMIDIDNFKQLNDTHGHLYGDEVLRKLGKLLLRYQNCATAFRFGGDEFCMLFCGSTAEEAQEILDRLRAEYRGLAKTQHSSLSMGVASYQYGTRPKQLLQEADMALYEAKRGHKDSIYFYQKTMRDTRPVAHQDVREEPDN